MPNPLNQRGESKMSKSEKAKLVKLDAMLDRWEADTKSGKHERQLAELEEKNKHDFDHFDHIAYQNYIYSNGHNA